MERKFGRRALSMMGITGVAALGASPAMAQTGDVRRPPHRMLTTQSMASVATLRATAGTTDGEQIHLLGYHADLPGVGGGTLYWDADATDADNGGTVIAVTGRPTGRWKRPVATSLDVAWFGVRGTGTEDDSARVQAAVDALPNGGTIVAGPGKVRLEHTVHVDRRPIVFEGVSPTREDEIATQYVVATGSANGFLFTGVSGGGFTRMQLRGEDLTGGSLVALDSVTVDGAVVGNYMVSFTHTRFKQGYNGVTLRACNSVRFQNCVWNEFHGQYAILLNGANNASRADPIEFVQCGIATGPENPGVDNVVVDGLGGSLKFFATAILFGRHGLWLRNTTGESTPKFVYFEGGGFENGHGVPVLLDAGSQAQFTNTYISGDGEQDNVRIGPAFGNATFTGCVLRGSGRNGMDIAGTRVTVSASLIGNNGRTAHPSFARTITGVANNGSGAIRVTTSAAHGWETDDRVSVLSVGGVPAANGKWSITVVSPTAFDLRGSTFSGTYSGGGTTYRHGAGINLRSTASRVVIVGNAIGGLADGVNRQDFGIVSEAADILVADNDLNGNLDGPYQLGGAQTAQTRVVGNKGVEQLDGWLTASLTGAVANGSYDLSGLLYLSGQRIRVVRVVRKLAAGTCSVRLAASGAAVGTAVAATTAVQSTALASPFVVDGTASPKRLELQVVSAASASGLEVQFGYQLVS